MSGSSKFYWRPDGEDRERGDEPGSARAVLVDRLVLFLPPTRSLGTAADDESLTSGLPLAQKCPAEFVIRLSLEKSLDSNETSPAAAACRRPPATVATSRGAGDSGDISRRRREARSKTFRPDRRGVR